MRTLLIACVICGLTIGGFLAGRASAQQLSRGEELTDYQFPMSWGSFRTVVPEEGGYVYFFEAVDGSIRTVDVMFGNPKGGTYLGRVHVIQRSADPLQPDSHGTLR
jgi:hypothetical protein